MVFDSKIEHYRTPNVNDVIGCVANTSKVLGEIKKPDSLNLLEKSGLVHTNPLLPNQIKQDLAKIEVLKYLEF